MFQLIADILCRISRRETRAEKLARKKETRWRRRYTVASRRRYGRRSNGKMSV